MKAVYKEPGKAARIVEIENSLQALQKAVGSYIETVTLFRTQRSCATRRAGCRVSPITARWRE